MSSAEPSGSVDSPRFSSAGEPSSTPPLSPQIRTAYRPAPLPLGGWVTTTEGLRTPAPLPLVATPEAFDETLNGSIPAGSIVLWVPSTDNENSGLGESPSPALPDLQSWQSPNPSPRLPWEKGLRMGVLVSLGMAVGSLIQGWNGSPGEAVLHGSAPTTTTEEPLGGSAVPQAITPDSGTPQAEATPSSTLSPGFAIGQSPAFTASLSNWQIAQRLLVGLALVPSTAAQAAHSPGLTSAGNPEQGLGGGSPLPPPPLVSSVPGGLNPTTPPLMIERLYYSPGGYALPGGYGAPIAPSIAPVGGSWTGSPGVWGAAPGGGLPVPPVSASSQGYPAGAPSHPNLMGVLEDGERSVALFEVDGVTQRFGVGEAIGSSEWVLLAVAQGKAIVENRGRVVALAVGQDL